MFGALRLPDTILFGPGKRRALGAAAARLGRRALVCTDSRLSAQPEFAEALEGLRAAGLEVHVYDRTIPDLPIECIEDCAKEAARFSPELVIGLGGGSCMDLAKLVAVVLAHGGPVSRYYGEFAVPGPVLPLVAVPTTAGTGSEVTPVAVVMDSGRGLKIGVASPHIIPRLAICDPSLTMTCPPRLTACSGADALAHAVEAFTGKRRPDDPLLTEQQVFVGKNVLSDHFARLAVAHVFRFLTRACRDGDDTEAREGLMLASLAAGCAFGTAGTAAAHALQYPVGNLTHTAHGDGVGALLPYVMQFNRSACAADLADLAGVIGLGEAGMDADERSQLFVDAVAELFASVGVPRTLAELGLATGPDEEIETGALNAERLVKNNPRALDLAGMLAITRAAFTGDRAALLNA
ncbi:iron-containing alcohol dehydrogenase [Bosea sp. (in: a-proteobacteria)]|uniref:iron-containing alcohol dehydrogenase n=1 Tax=Bosea sp. (in: a-proteobacteria) TaxID=1871050 RepID=UPI0027352F3F|nr:iron-containing alcohol dehydrogenase [Bosea sp. (in: a-proteobacteria)]MDP3256174.1 iron-containing alcohol dehydrogenase [Bosea sp. (in: a-proteobacteria)]